MDTIEPQEASQGLSVDIQDSTFCLIKQIAEEKYGLNLHRLDENVLRRRLAGLIRRQLFRSAEDYAHHISMESYDPIMGDLMCLICDPPFRFCLHPQAIHFLMGQGLSHLLDSSPDEDARHLRFWNAGCFSGEETYTYMLALSEGQSQGQAFDIVALGTGCSTPLLEKARNGLYAQEALEAVSPDWIEKYFISHRMGTEGVYEVCPQIRQRVVFTPLILLGQWELTGEYDLIVCAHLMCYLVPQAQGLLAQRLCRYLRHGGLFITQPNLALSTPLCSQIHPGVYLRF